MAKRRGPWVHGLDRFGLTLRTVRRLGDRLVTVKAAIPPAPYVYPGPATFRRLVRKTPRERAALCRAWRSAKVAKLRSEPQDAVSVRAYRFGRFLAGLHVTMRAKDVPRVSRWRHAESVEVVHVVGLRPTTSPVTVAPGPRLYAVKARVAMQVEGQRSGHQGYEDRVVVVAARTEKVAALQVARLLKLEEAPVLLEQGHFMRRHFEEVLDVWECDDLAGFQYPLRRLNPKGTEVGYELGQRRVTRTRIWRPA